MSADQAATLLHADLLSVRAKLRARDFTEVESLVRSYRQRLQQSLRCTPATLTREQCRQLRELHTSLLEEMRELRDEAGNWLRQQRRTSAAIEAYNRSARRLFRWT